MELAVNGEWGESQSLWADVLSAVTSFVGAIAPGTKQTGLLNQIEGRLLPILVVLRHDTHLFQRPKRRAPFWPDIHPEWLARDQTCRANDLPKSREP